MDVSELVSRCKLRMTAQNLTNRDVARLADISEATVSRVLSSDGRAASAATIESICQALEIDAAPESSESVDSMVSLLDAHYRRHIEDLQRQIASKERWLRVTVLICVCLIALFVLLLAADLLIPSHGWIRRGGDGYLANAASGVFHRSGCPSAAAMSGSNRLTFATAQEAIDAGFRACHICLD